jgi:hypothetical protein
MHIILKRKKVTKKEKTHSMWITETVTHIECVVIITIMIRFKPPETVNAIQALSLPNP